MRLFRRRPAADQQFVPEPEPQQPEPAAPPISEALPGTPQTGVPTVEPEAAQSNESGVVAVKPPVSDGEVSVSRTLVKSEPELVEQVAANPRLNSEGVEVTLAEKGFGTRVSIIASPASGASIEELESILNQLAESSKRPFSKI